jgi:hypothetical protein
LKSVKKDNVQQHLVVDPRRVSIESRLIRDSVELSNSFLVNFQPTSLTGKFTNAELNLAGSGGFGPEDDVALISISLKNLPVLDTIGSIDPYLRISSKKPNAESWVQQVGFDWTGRLGRWY